MLEALYWLSYDARLFIIDFDPTLLEGEGYIKALYLILLLYF